MELTNRHPIDCDTLNKGDVISVDVLQKITKKPQGSQEYAFKLMSLQSFIHDKRADLTVRIDHDTIRILTDKESSEYNDQVFKMGMRKMKTSNGRLLMVDYSGFSDDEKQRHLRKIEVNSRTYQATILGRRGKLILPPVVRNTPGLMK